MIYLSERDDLEHDLSDLPVRGGGMLPTPHNLVTYC